MRATCIGLLVWLMAISAMEPVRCAPQAIPDYAVREWHVQDGLPHEEVYKVLQDHTGYLWVGTTGGLVRFDGARFQPWTVSGAGMGEQFRIRQMVNVPGLGIVMAPEQGGLWICDGTTVRVASLPGLPTDLVVTTLFVDPDGGLWLVCVDGQIYRFLTSGVEAFAAPDDFDKKRYAYFATDARNRVWIASGTYLGRYERGRLQRVPIDFDNSELRIATSRGNGPWIVTRSHVYPLEGDDLGEGVEVPTLVGAHYVLSLLEDRAGALWLGTRSLGLHVIIGGRRSVVPTPQEIVMGLTEDTEGGVWVAMNGGGLARLRPKVATLYNRESGLGDSFTYTLCEDCDGVMWLANRDGGVACIREGKVESVTARLGWPTISAVCVYPANEDHLWAGGAGYLFRIERGPNERMTRLESIPLLPIVRVAYVDSRADLWVSVDPDQVGRIHEGHLTCFGTTDGLDGSELRAVTEDGSGRLWFGTYAGGLFQFVDGRFVPVSFKRPDCVGPIQAILVEGDGPVWLATAGTGLGVIVNGHFRALTTRHGMVDNSLSQIVPDGQGYFWFASERGIFRVSRHELGEWLEGRVERVHAVNLAVEEGLKGLACLGMFQPAAWRGRDGRLWFATRRGVLAFDPAHAVQEVPAPPVFIDEVTCDGRPLSVAAMARPVEIPAAARKITFRFSVLCFAAPERVQIRYRLRGFDQMWMSGGSDRTATYPTLPPGDYCMEVVASDGDGAWNDGGATLAFSVLPLWWQTWLFRIGMLAALVGSVAFVVRTWSHRRLKRRLERLERESAIARERTRIANDIHDDLGASLTRISLLSQCARRDAVATNRTYIDQIYETTTEVTRAMDEIVWAVNPRHDNLDSLVGYLGNYAQSYLSVAGVRCRLDLPEDVPDVVLTGQTRHTLYLCCREALNNIVKHARATEASIVVRIVDGSVVLSITDNGCGLPVAGSLDGAEHDLRRSSTGHGLENIRRRMTGISGTGDVKRAPEGGTAVDLVFGLAQTTSIFEE